MPNRGCWELRFKIPNVNAMGMLELNSAQRFSSKLLVVLFGLDYLKTVITVTTMV